MDTEPVKAAEKPEFKPTTFQQVDLEKPAPRYEPPPAPKPAPVAEPPKPKPVAASAKPVAAPAKPVAAPAKPAPAPPVAPPTKEADASLLEISQPRTFSKRLEPVDKPAAFTEKLSPEALDFFNDVCHRPISQQAIAFLNAYWSEVGSQAEFIFSVAYEMFKYADMHSKGIQYIHLYEEGTDLDFNIGLYFYEKLCKLVLDDAAGKQWRDDKKYKPSMPEMLTALVRKQELREKVDVNFDGRVSFLEYLLYQYRAYANPADFTKRSMAQGSEHDAIRKARLALEEVNKAVRAFETEKARLQQEADEPGVKGLGAKHQLSILFASPLAEKLNAALITAEAAVRIAGRKFGASGSVFSVAPVRTRACMHVCDCGADALGRAPERPRRT